MPRSYLKWGDWNAICDECGFKFKASEMRERWDGLMVCEKDWETRHPQDFLRVRGDDVSVPWVRTEGADVFVNNVCYLWDQSAFAGLGTAGCMQAGYLTPFTYAQLLALKAGIT